MSNYRFGWKVEVGDTACLGFPRHRGDRPTLEMRKNSIKLTHRYRLKVWLYSD